jgi:hypothetical protein
MEGMNPEMMRFAMEQMVRLFSFAFAGEAIRWLCRSSLQLTCARAPPPSLSLSSLDPPPRSTPTQKNMSPAQVRATAAVGSRWIIGGLHSPRAAAARAP